MKNNEMFYGVIGLIVGVLATGIIMALAPKGTALPTPNSDEKNSILKSNSMSMEDMMINLKGKTGDEFDKTFISEMMQHHQGAISMADLAKKDAKHDELKKLANDIISAQTTEINVMKQWQKNWGYSDISMSSEKSWDDARMLISSCKVMSTVETHTGILILAQKDGSTVTVRNYNKQELDKDILEANSKCKEKIVIGME